MDVQKAFADAVNQYSWLYPGTEIWEALVTNIVYRQARKGNVEEALRLVGNLSAHGQHRAVLNIVEVLIREKFFIPEERFVQWGKAACRAGDYRSGALIIFAGECQLSELLNTKEIEEWAYLSTMRIEDHGIPRLFILLLLRLKPKKHGVLSVQRAKILATIVLRTYIESSIEDRAVLPGILFRMLRESLSEKGCALVRTLYMEGVRIHLVQTAQVAKQALEHTYTLK